MQFKEQRSGFCVWSGSPGFIPGSLTSHAIAYCEADCVAALQLMCREREEGVEREGGRGEGGEGGGRGGS